MKVKITDAVMVNGSRVKIVRIKESEDFRSLCRGLGGIPTIAEAKDFLMGVGRFVRMPASKFLAQMDF